MPDCNGCVCLTSESLLLVVVVWNVAAACICLLKPLRWTAETVYAGTWTKTTPSAAYTTDGQTLAKWIANTHYITAKQ